MAQRTTSSDPLHIAVSKSKGVTIEWTDGHRSDYSVAYLRDECPCANCTGAHGTPPQKSNYSAETKSSTELFPMYKEKLKMNSIEEVGGYAFRIHWNDAHNAGIYSYEYLREICPCAACREAASKS